MLTRLSLLLLGFGLLNTAFAQEQAAPAAGTSPLGIRQQRVERMMDDLEGKFKALKLAIQQNEPDRAERLQNALNKAKELLIQKRMTEIGQLLDQSQLDSASGAQAAILTDIRTLLSVLLNEAADSDKTRAELEQLEAWRKQIEALIQSEQQELRESERLTKLDQQQLQALPPEVLEQLARRQAELASQTSQLAEQFQTSPSSASMQPLQQAQRAMQQAAGDLRQRNPSGASRQETDALKELLEALKDVKERQENLTDQQRSETLAKLEATFREMLAAQQQLTKQTAALEIKRSAAGGQLSRGDRNAVRAIGDEERRLQPIQSDTVTKEPGLAGKAQAALDQIKDDKTSAALSAVIEQLRDDFIAVGTSLVDDLRTDSSVAKQQQTIEKTLQELIDALQKASQQQAASSQGEGELPGEPGDSPSQKKSLATAQGGKTGGGSKGVDGDATQRLQRGGPQSPWSQLRDKERDPVYSAIKEKFPARYQQLIEQYYKSFQNDDR